MTNLLPLKSSRWLARLIQALPALLGEPRKDAPSLKPTLNPPARSVPRRG